MFIRNCPQCGKELSYGTKGSWKRSEDRNSPCLSCSAKGNKNNLGRKRSEESRRKISKSMKGNNNTKGYVWTEEQRQTLSIAKGGTGLLPKFSKTKIKLWADKAKEITPFCEWCYSEDNLEAHHIMPKAKFPRYAYDLDNARVMCYQCHKTCHKQGGY